MENKIQVDSKQQEIPKQELEDLIKKAKEKIEERKEYHTKASIFALEDMIEKAIAAVNGAEKDYFNRNREFIKEEAGNLKFALCRYTMVPTYLPDGSAYSKYGLEPALAWFQEEDMLLCGEEKLNSRINTLVQNAKEACECYPIGQKLGDYNKKKRDHLINTLELLNKAKTMEDRAKAVVKCFDAYDAFRKSRVLKSDLSPNQTLFYSWEEWENLKEEIQTDAIKKEVYQQIKALADSHSLEEINQKYKDCMNDTSYEELNSRYYLWSSTGKTVNFFTPNQIQYATIEISLPSIENEEEGLGHVWIDNIKILSADGEDVVIKNAGFEQGKAFPDDWINLSSNIENASLEERPVYCGTEKKSLFLRNKTKKEEAKVKYSGKLELKPQKGYTLVFDAKLDGKCKEGIRFNIIYYNQQGEEMGNFLYYFNKKSYLSPSDYPLTAQCDAICYAITEDIAYAQKAKFQILFSLNDFCQGAEHWLITNLRPDQSDAYGAVQGGRILCSIASAYSLIKKADCFNKKEKEIFYKMVGYLLDYMLDLRNRTELSKEGAQKNCSNWQTDMCAGTAMMMLVLEDYPNRRVWLDNAVYILRSQLEFNINKDGSWPESIRYHFAAMERFLTIAKVLKVNIGEDWFQDTKLVEMFRYSLKVQTPSYCYFDGHPATPPFGDHVLDNGKEFAVYGLYLNDVKKIDPELAKQMYETWKRAGKPIKDFKTESVALENLFCQDDRIDEGKDKVLLEASQTFQDAGLYIFRDKVLTSQESYFAVMSSPSKIGHGHLDQGSFLLYYNQIPIIMDSGVEGYFDSSVQWHLSSYSHACMQFQTKQKKIEEERSQLINLNAGTYSLKKGWVDVPVQSKVLAYGVEGKDKFIQIEIKNPEGNGRHIRTIRILQDEDTYIIQDEVFDFEGEILFSIPIVAESCEQSKGNEVFAKGYYDVDLKVQYKSTLKRLWLEDGRALPFFPSKQSVGMLKYVRAVADARDGFEVVLKPQQRK